MGGDTQYCVILYCDSATHCEQMGCSFHMPDELTETQSEGECDGQRSYLVNDKHSQRVSCVHDSQDAIY